MSEQLSINKEKRSEPVPRSKGGCPQDPVWTHFIQTPLATAGHFAAECLYCGKKWPRGRPQDLQVHLAKDCLNVDDEIRRVFVRNILRLCDDDDDIIDDESNKHQKLDQLNITNFWDMNITKHYQNQDKTRWINL
ncbi:hypothetical protein RhiirB3_454871 [Rhizophagus irregularis]|nr:hypothetical protein RhiirB3_454871 [Rhizophagus irregularis]